MTRRSQHAGRTAVDDSVNNTRSVHLPPSPMYRRGMQPKPQDAKGLYRECTRISWSLHCLQRKRSELAVILDRWDVRVAKLRREHDACLALLEHASPELYARAEERRREWDDPRKALAWATDHGDTEVLP